MDRNDGKGERDVVYVGRYHCATKSYKSTTGVIPANDSPRNDMFTSCHAIGDTYYMMDFATRFTLWLLYLVEMASWNSQADIGYGTGDKTAQNMGYTDGMKYCTGTTQRARTTYGLGTQWRNIEGLWDNVYDWMSGCYLGYVDSIKGICIITDASKLEYLKDGKLVGKPPKNGFVGELTVSDTGGFPMFYGSSLTGGSETAGTCDYWSDDSGGTPSALIVGSEYSFTNQSCGMFQVHADNSSSHVINLGCRLMELP